MKNELRDAIRLYLNYLKNSKEIDNKFNKLGIENLNFKRSLLFDVLENMREVHEVDTFLNIKEELDGAEYVSDADHQNYCRIELDLEDAKNNLLNLFKSDMLYSKAKSNPYILFNDKDVKNFCQRFVEDDLTTKEAFNHVEGILDWIGDKFYNDYYHNEHFKILYNSLLSFRELPRFCPDDWVRRNLYYPNMHLKNIPPELHEELNNLLFEVRMCYVYGCYYAGLALIRSTLELALKKKYGFSEKASLIEMTESYILKESKPFKNNKHLLSLVHIIRDYGNTALHGSKTNYDEVLKPSKLQESAENLREVLESLF